MIPRGRRRFLTFGNEHDQGSDFRLQKCAVRPEGEVKRQIESSIAVVTRHRRGHTTRHRMRTPSQRQATGDQDQELHFCRTAQVSGAAGWRGACASMIGDRRWGGRRLVRPFVGQQLVCDQQQKLVAGTHPQLAQAHSQPKAGQTRHQHSLKNTPNPPVILDRNEKDRRGTLRHGADKKHQSGADASLGDAPE